MNKKIILALGKLRRICFVHLRPKKTAKLLKQRWGECRRCGACCKLLFRCPALREKNGITFCGIYKYRSRVCRLFPLDEKDLAERDLVKPDVKCGFWFEKEP